jgi:hypothetical protein
VTLLVHVGFGASKYSCESQAFGSLMRTKLQALRMNHALDPASEQVIQCERDRGHFTSPAEFVASALRLLTRRRTGSRRTRKPSTPLLELDAIPHLFPKRHGICAQALCLPQAEGGDSAGILQPPVFRWLGVTRRCHVFAHLVEVMGLRRGGCNIQLFDVPGSDVNDCIDVLQRSLDEQEAGIRHQ